MPDPTSHQIEMFDPNPPIPPDRNVREGGSEDPDRQHGHIPDLATTLQTMTITHQPTVVIGSTPSANPTAGATAHNILMKVGDTAGTARILPLHVVQTALKGAWGRNYSSISEIAPNLFMAHFQDARALQFVWARQPWTVGKETLLLEWVNPDAQAKPLELYRFAKLYVTVRFYGIPQSIRKLPNAVDILVTPLFFLKVKENLHYSLALGISPDTRSSTKSGIWHIKIQEPGLTTLAPWAASLSATELQALGQTETIH